MNSRQPLAGIKVIALEQAVAGPYCTRLLLDLGAEVIKIERPGSGDFVRHYDTSVKGLSAYFVALNRGKRSLSLNIQHPKSREILARLIKNSDVFVHNMKDDSIRNLNLNYPSVSKINPSKEY
jgi:itaconate CoA-transferase